MAEDPVAITAELLRTLPLPEPREGAKEGRGHVGIVGGSREVAGAVWLAATAALRAGAGKLQIATSESIAPHLGLALPEALVIGVPESSAGEMERIPAALLKRFARCDAVLIGPGMMAKEAGDATVADFLAGDEDASLVLDAGVLSNLAAQGELVRARDGRVVVTPHAGEMAHLLGRDRTAIEADPLTAAREAASLLGAVAVSKGARTFVVDPKGCEWSYDGGSVGLATSGSGDVLAGLIAGLLARGARPSEAAIWGVFLHGEAGARLARAQGRLGFLAREISGEVPRIMAAFDTESG